MSRSAGKPLPPPLPPAERTVGQLVAESVRLYGRSVWWSLAIGLPPAAVSIAVASMPRVLGFVLFATAGAVLLTASYIGGVVLAHAPPLDARRVLTAFAAGVLVFLPFSVLVYLYVLPGLAWLALFGLAVPAALSRAWASGLRSDAGCELGRADYIHALGGLAALTIVVVFVARPLTAVALAELRRQHGASGGLPRRPRRLADPLPRRRDPLRRPGARLS